MLSRPRKLLPGVAQGVSLPAPIGGLNTFNPAMGLPPTDCMLLRNMVAAENGLRVRLGSREWATGVSGAADRLVRTLIPYAGSSPSATRLFATTSSGIWDVTTSGAVIGGAYAASTAYAAGAGVSLSGGSYLCATAGTSDAGGAPPAWQANHNYVMWDMVTSSGSVYVLQQLYATSGSVAQAPTGAADFQDLEQFFFWIYVGVAGACPNNKSLPPPRANLTAYKVGARAVFGGYVWHCSQPGTTGATEPDANLGGTSDGSAVWSAQMNVGGALSSAGVADSAIDDNTAVWRYVPHNTAPTVVCSFTDATGDAGHGVAHSHTTTAGNFIWYADEENGLFLYTESTDTWAAVSAASVTGVDPADLVFATVFKGFSLFAVRDSTEVRVLPINSISGATSRMDVGYKSQAGGSIVGIWPWTRDGGSGLDDGVVFATSGGDVMVYQGTDPTDSASFGNTGVWGVGKMPAGRNLGTKFGGDLLLLTRAGIVSMNTLTSGLEGGATQYQTAKVQGLFNNLMSTRSDLRGWSLVLHPEESALVVTVPQGEGAATTQLAMSLATRSWSELRDLDIYACASHEGKLFFGTTDGRVQVNDGSVDGVTLAAPGVSTPIDFQGIGAFQNFGVGAPKQAHLVKYYFQAGSAPTVFDVAVRFDFDLTEMVQQSAVTSASGNVWDSATWDSGTWSEGYAAFSAIRGASGIGSHLAVAWRGWAVDRTVLTGFELSFSVGGGL